MDQKLKINSTVKQEEEWTINIPRKKSWLLFLNYLFR